MPTPHPVPRLQYISRWLPWMVPREGVGGEGGEDVEPFKNRCLESQTGPWNIDYLECSFSNPQQFKEYDWRCLQTNISKNDSCLIGRTPLGICFLDIFGYFWHAEWRKIHKTSGSTSCHGHPSCAPDDEGQVFFHEGKRRKIREELAWGLQNSLEINISSPWVVFLYYLPLENSVPIRHTKISLWRNQVFKHLSCVDNDNDCVWFLVLPLPPDHLTLNRKKITLKKKKHLQVACSKDFDLTLQDVEMESLEVWEFNWKGGNRRVDFCWWLVVVVKCPVDTTW